MRTSLRTGIVIAFVGAAILGSSCQSQPKPTPSPSPTEDVVIVVVTSTSQPTLAPTETMEATITPLATFTPIGLETPTPTRRATTTPAAVKTAPPSKTKPASTPTAEPPTSTPPPDKYPAPIAISPKAGDSNSDRGDIQFYYGAVGPLGANECYLLYIQMVNPNATAGGVAGDTFMDTNQCGDPSPPGKPLKYVLFRPTFHNVRTFGTIERNAQNAAPTDLLKLQWFVRVVLNNGPSPDGVHYNTVPLSPESATLESDFRP